ncbi:MAG: hypothetical protein ACOH2L_08775 [Devosia sp.]
MTHFPKIATPAVAALALIISASAAFATPTVTIAKPGSGMPIDDFKSQMAAFNPSEVSDLANAKTITVIKYDTAWTGSPKADKPGTDNMQAMQLLTVDASQIDQLRAAIKANTAATKVLSENNIAVSNLVDIVSDGAGNVSLYVS